MPTIASLAVAAAVALGVTTAAADSDLAPRVFEAVTYRRDVADPIARDRQRMLRKRQSKTLGATLDNAETLYYINASIGTPAQNFALHLDTGSSDLWVNVAGSSLCESKQRQCQRAGTYSANASSTYKYVNSLFNITYVDGSGSSGDYATDTVSVAGATLQNQQFGIGYTSSSAQGILGIGYPTDEVASAYDRDSPYANVPQSMANSGQINSDAYSLWLNDVDASTGSVLFGGVNSGKYTGSLQTVPIIKVEGEYVELIIAMTAVGINGTSGSIASNLAAPALLDSGSSLMYLPDNITQDIYTAVGAKVDRNSGAAIVNCDLANSPLTLDFTFSSPTISVSMSELVIIIGEAYGEYICMLGIQPAGPSTAVLGDTFLRSAYVVYDLSQNQISLAQTDFNSTTDHVQAIPSSGTVPGATVVSNAVTAVVVQTGGSRLGGGYTTTIGSAAQPTAPPAWNAALLGAAGAAALFAL